MSPRASSFCAEELCAVPPAEREQLDDALEVQLRERYRLARSFDYPSGRRIITHESEHYEMLRRLRPVVAAMTTPVYLTLHEEVVRGEREYEVSAAVVADKGIIEGLSPIEDIAVNLAPTSPSSADVTRVQVRLSQLERRDELTQDIAHYVLAVSSEKRVYDFRRGTVPLRFPELGKYVTSTPRSQKRLRR